MQKDVVEKRVEADWVYWSGRQAYLQYTQWAAAVTCMRGPANMP